MALEWLDLVSDLVRRWSPTPPRLRFGLVWSESLREFHSDTGIEILDSFTLSSL